MFGKICFADEEITVYNYLGVPETVTAKRGQIFIDPDTGIVCNIGCLHNTLAHELFHWVRHRLYATIKRLFGSPDFKSTKCRMRTGAVRNDGAELTDGERMELHANAISPRIVMPTETAKPKAGELLAKHGYDPSRLDAEQVLRAVIVELSDLFQVSKQLATIRLSQFGITQAQDIYDADEERNILCTSQIPYADVLREYSENDKFRAAIESGLFRYAEGRFIVNDPRYIGKADGGIYILTDYAREHLNECALRFETTGAETKGYESDGLYRKNKAGFALLKKYVEEAATLETAAAAKANTALKDLAARDRQYLAAVGSGTFFSESFNALMRAYFEPSGVSEHKYGAEFFEATGIPDNKYRDMRNGDAGYCPTHRRITAICAGFDFDVTIAEALLRKGGKSYTSSDEHTAFRLLLTAFRGCGTTERSDYLEAMGHGRLSDDK